ncbi:type III pantothenate kinase [Shouchella shacheensis]|uniref:type III pantothenate kinase n=1 Tax=Shouchella shacheensis TaxID=1649580 RepID=UPI00074011C0|nr:type III pantothenate kinase [Shouchella shacheensis]
MILAIDVGNSSIVLGMYQGQRLLGQFRVATSHEKTSDEYAVLLQSFLAHKSFAFEDVEGVIISSVVPTIMHRLETMCQDYLEKQPLVVGPGVKTSLNIKVENPREVGADRIANAVAGIAEYGTPLIIIDFGTATTFCFIDKEQSYRGGVISPGASISAEALYTRASKLPRVALGRPKTVLGKNTAESMKAGTFFGYSSLVDGIVGRIKEEQDVAFAKVIATGGLASLFEDESSKIDVWDPQLTLKGLRLIYDKNVDRMER